MQFLRRGFDESQVQGLKLSEAAGFSREAREVDAKEGFHLLTPVRSAFNSEEGLKLVEGEAASVFGVEAAETRTIAAVRKTRTLAKTADLVIHELQGAVTDLLSGFDDLDSLLSDAS